MLNCRYIPSLKPGDPSPSEPKRESSFPGFGVQGYEFLSKQVGRNLIGRPRKKFGIPTCSRGRGGWGVSLVRIPHYRDHCPATLGLYDAQFLAWEMYMYERIVEANFRTDLGPVMRKSPP